MAKSVILGLQKIAIMPSKFVSDHISMSSTLILLTTFQ